MTQLLLFNITNGLIIGAFYVLMALGLSLILNLSNVINFAHGGFLVIGGSTPLIRFPPPALRGRLLPRLPARRLFMLAVVMVAVALLFLLLRYTRLGVRIRAGTLDLETVAALGINVQMLRSLNFAVGIFLAGLSGVLAAGQLGLEPTMGTGLLMPSFIAIIVGGIGSLPGTLAGGLLIGVASGLTAVFYPAASEAVIYVMMAVGLLLRPRGLFGEEGMMS